MKMMVSGFMIGLAIVLAATRIVGAQAATVQPTSVPRWQMGSATEPISLQDAKDSRVTAFVDANATKVRANLNDPTAVGTVLTKDCTGTAMPWICTATNQAQQLAGSTVGSHLMSLVFELRRTDGTYAPRVMGVPTACDFTFQDTRPSVPGRNIQWVDALLGLVGFHLPVNG